MEDDRCDNASRLDYIERVHMHAIATRIPPDRMTVEANNDGSSFGAGHTYTHICEQADRNVRTAQRLEKSTTRGMHARRMYVHARNTQFPRAQVPPADENSTRK